MIESGRNWRRKKFLSQNKNVRNQVRCFGEIMTIKVKRTKHEPKYCWIEDERKRNHTNSKHERKPKVSVSVKKRFF